MPDPLSIPVPAVVFATLRLCINYSSSGLAASSAKVFQPASGRASSSSGRRQAALVWALDSEG